MEEQPVITSTAIVAVVATLIDIAVAFGIHITPDQKQAILAGIPAIWVMALAIAALIHPNVRSLAQARSIKKAAFELGRKAGPPQIAGRHMTAALDAPVEPTLAQVEDYAAKQNIKAAA